VLLFTAWAFLLRSNITRAVNWTFEQLIINAILTLMVVMISTFGISYYVINKFTWSGKLLVHFSNRLTIFLFLYLPATVISIIVISIRNFK
jgi:hypothetical protein